MLRRSRAELVFSFDGRRVAVAKGKSTASICGALGGILSEAGMGKCEVHVLPNGKVELGENIPAALHQQIRNVIVG